MYVGLSNLRQMSAIVALCVVWCFGAAFGQSDETSYAGQKPIEVQVTRQDDSPLSIAVTSVDNSDASTQTVNLLVHNVTAKPVRGYVMAISGVSSGSRGTGSLTKVLFEPYEMR